VTRVNFVVLMAAIVAIALTLVVAGRVYVTPVATYLSPLYADLYAKLVPLMADRTTADVTPIACPVVSESALAEMRDRLAFLDLVDADPTGDSVRWAISLGGTRLSVVLDSQDGDCLATAVNAGWF
jgi:hypothetical protein